MLPTCVIGHGVEPFEVSASPPEASRTSILFVGRLTDADSPNVDALNWFIREVMPRLDEDLRRHVRVAGAVDKDLLEPTTEAWILGPVEDLTEQYAAARVLLAPQRFAAGVPLKVIHAAAAGVPVVATPLIAAQLGWESGRELAVAVTPDQFAEEIRMLFDDDVRWRGIRDRALAEVQLRYEPTVFRESVVDAMKLIGIEP